MKSTKPINDIEEIQPDSLHHFAIDRRQFFKMLGSGLAVSFVVTDSLANGFLDSTLIDDVDEKQISAWIHIGENEKITVFTGKVEVGQNIRTSLAQIVAEELHVPLPAIEMIMGDTDLTPYDRGTYGSLSTPVMGPQLRKAAASTRELLLETAGKEWGVDKSFLKVDNGRVVDTKSQKSISFGTLAKGKELLQNINDDVAVTPVDQWKIAGTSVHKVNGKAFVTGKHRYTSDMNVPGMLYGKVLRPSTFGATLKSVDVAAADAMTDVIVVQDGNFIGVVAPSGSIAEQALSKIVVQWDSPQQPGRKEIFDYLVKHSDGDRSAETKGNVDEAYTEGAVKIDQTFHVDYIAHAPLEPRAAVAEWKDGKVTVWTGTQRPFGVQEELMNTFHLSKENARVIVPDTGSGYGGKHTGDAALEAARLAKAANKPVKLVWTREEEFTWAYFRPAGVITVKAAAGKEGKMMSWEFHNYNSGGSGIETPYAIDHQKVIYHPVKSPLRQGSYRGLAATANIFARESIMNDLADELKIDPLEFRLANLQNERLKNVLLAATEKFNWKNAKREKGHGFGLACGDEKGSFIATCAEVVQDDSSDEGIKIVRVVAAFECGAIINPGHLESQILGSVVQGLGGALFERVDFDNGKILNPLFSGYRVPRFNDIPHIEVVMLNRKDIPSVGAGETPIFCIAPAIRNAIGSATGKKLYKLPLLGNSMT